MTSRFDSSGGGDVISLDAARWWRRGEDRAVLTSSHHSCATRGKDTVFFITGGRFEVMVNGVVAVLSTGDFVRVPDGAAHGFCDIGLISGTLLSHRFALEAEPGFLRELAGALPPFAKAMPHRGTPGYARLKAIARRWGVALGSDEAA